ncbi:MAG: MmcQ/YjbR family DNA-binding protein [Vicinamibacterales bacterium]
MPARRRKAIDSFAVVRSIGLTLPGVEAGIRYDGSPVLKWGGAFMAGLAQHHTAEAATLVVRMSVEERQLLLDEAPQTYYITEYYERYPLVLVRLSQVDDDALRDLLSVSWRMTLEKGRPNARAHRQTRRATRPAPSIAGRR